MSWTIRRVFAAVAVVVALGSLASCGGGDGDDSATPEAVRTATTKADSVVLARSDLGEGWDPLPDETGTPTANTGPDSILDRAFRSWAGCVGNVLSGGFVGLGRAGTASSARFIDADGRIVAGAVAVFLEKERADQVVSALGASSGECSQVGDFRIESGEVPAAGAAAAAYRLTVTLETRGASFTETFDLVVVRSDLIIEALVFKRFGANDDRQEDIIARAAAKIAA